MPEELERPVEEHVVSLSHVIVAQERAKKKVRHLYLSGPITGIPNDNHPLFNSVAAALRKQGFHVFNPACNDETKPRWYLMAIDLIQVLLADGVAVLPGWNKSLGASLEVTIALETGKRIFEVEGDGTNGLLVLLDEITRRIQWMPWLILGPERK
jgi:hypothetical protein